MLISAHRRTSIQDLVPLTIFPPCPGLLESGGIHAYTGKMKYQDIITIEPGKRGGKPCVRGMRITVYDVLSYLASGMTHQEILTDFPYLTEEDILACLSYAADRERQQLVVKA